MAIYHLKVKALSRAAGQSAVAAAAYRACAKMEDERTGQAPDFRRKGGHLAGGLVGWDGEASDLWNAAEASEKRKDAKLAREIVVALPAGLPLADQEALVRGFAADLRERHGFAIQWDIHAPSKGKGGDDRNVHAHLMLTTRRVEAGRLTEKTRELDVKMTSGAHLEAWRAAWEGRVNDTLARAGSAERIDRRSHAQRHLDEGRAGPPPEPASHLGPARTALERRGRKTRAGRRNDAVAEAAKLRKQVAALDRQLASLAGPARAGQAAWHAGRLARDGGRVAVWTAGATAATLLRLAGFRVRRPRLPGWAVAGVVKSAGGLAVAAGQAARRALARRHARRAVPAEVLSWWRAVAHHRPAAEVAALRAAAFSALTRSHPDRNERAAAVRLASAALPRRWRVALAQADRAAKAARLDKVEATAETARLAQDAAQARAALALAAFAARPAPPAPTRPMPARPAPSPDLGRAASGLPLVPRRTSTSPARTASAPTRPVADRTTPSPSLAGWPRPTNHRPDRADNER